MSITEIQSANPEDAGRIVVDRAFTAANPEIYDFKQLPLAPNQSRIEEGQLDCNRNCPFIPGSPEGFYPEGFAPMNKKLAYNLEREWDPGFIRKAAKEVPLLEGQRVYPPLQSQRNPDPPAETTGPSSGTDNLGQLAPPPKPPEIEMQCAARTIDGEIEMKCTARTVHPRAEDEPIPVPGDLRR